MGASTFSNFVKRQSKPDGFTETREGTVKVMRQKYGNWPSALQAFVHAREQEAWEHGHGGYTGTLAEKGEFTMIATVDTKEEAKALANKLIEENDPRIDDKWGPAGCIEVKGDDGGWLFFGWASC